MEADELGARERGTAEEAAERARKQLCFDFPQVAADDLHALHAQWAGVVRTPPSAVASPAVVDRARECGMVLTQALCSGLLDVASQASGQSSPESVALARKLCFVVFVQMPVHLLHTPPATLGHFLDAFTPAAAPPSAPQPLFASAALPRDGCEQHGDGDEGKGESESESGSDDMFEDYNDNGEGVARLVGLIHHSSPGEPSPATPFEKLHALCSQLHAHHLEGVDLAPAIALVRALAAECRSGAHAHGKDLGSLVVGLSLSLRDHVAANPARVVCAVPELCDALHPNPSAHGSAWGEDGEWEGEGEGGKKGSGVVDLGDLTSADLAMVVVGSLAAHYNQANSSTGRGKDGGARDAPAQFPPPAVRCLVAQAVARLSLVGALVDADAESGTTSVLGGMACAMVECVARGGDRNDHARLLQTGVVAGLVRACVTAMQGERFPEAQFHTLLGCVLHSQAVAAFVCRVQALMQACAAATGQGGGGGGGGAARWSAQSLCAQALVLLVHLRCGVLGAEQALGPLSGAASCEGADDTAALQFASDWLRWWERGVSQPDVTPAKPTAQALDGILRELAAKVRRAVSAGQAEGQGEVDGANGGDVAEVRHKRALVVRRLEAQLKRLRLDAHHQSKAD